MEEIWYRFDRVKIDDLKQTLLLDIASAPSKNLTFYIGGDSQFHKGKVTYTTALIMLLGGKGGRGYYHTHKERNKVTIQQRLFTETYEAVAAAMWINPYLETLGFNIKEIHTDLNPSPNHKSHAMVQTCLGYITGMGFEGVIKPNSWASSTVADYRTKPKRV